MAIFNLNKFLKKAYYEGGKGQSQGRTWGNCQKQKMDSGMSLQEAAMSCIKEYNDLDGGEWKTKYATGIKEK